MKLDYKILWLDDKIEDFDFIFENYKKRANFIVISNKKYNDVILNLNEENSFESILEQIKIYLKNIN
jgi:hypothetical protein